MFENWPLSKASLDTKVNKLFKVDEEDLMHRVLFFIERVERRIAENENTLRVHPDRDVREKTEVRLAAYRSVLMDAKQIMFEGK